MYDEPSRNKPCARCEFIEYDSFHDERFCTHDPVPSMIGHRPLVSEWGTCEYWKLDSSYKDLCEVSIPVLRVDLKAEKDIDEYFDTKAVKTKKVNEDYCELLMAVETKYPNETRHQTALRYIREAEDIGLDMKVKCASCNGTGTNVLNSGYCFDCKGDGCTDNKELIGIKKYKD